MPYVLAPPTGENAAISTLQRCETAEQARTEIGYGGFHWSSIDARLNGAVETCHSLRGCADYLIRLGYQVAPLLGSKGSGCPLWTVGWASTWWLRNRPSKLSKKNEGWGWRMRMLRILIKDDPESGESSGSKACACLEEHRHRSKCSSASAARVFRCRIDGALAASKL